MNLKSLFCVVMVLACSGISPAVLEEFNGVQVEVDYWTGSGSNSALLVVDWNDGIEPQGLAWGFKWNGEVTGRVMLDAINAESDRFFEVYDATWTAGTSTVYGLGYDVDDDGGSFVSTARGVETGYATDSDDHYQEGWFVAGFWAYNQSINGTDWAYGGYGIADRILSDGDWDGLSFAASPTWSDTIPDAPIVPEPITLALLGFGGILMRRRKP